MPACKMFAHYSFLKLLPWGLLCKLWTKNPVAFTLPARETPLPASHTGTRMSSSMGRNTSLLHGKTEFLKWDTPVLEKQERNKDI